MGRFQLTLNWHDLATSPFEGHESDRFVATRSCSAESYSNSQYFLHAQVGPTTTKPCYYSTLLMRSLLHQQGTRSSRNIVVETITNPQHAEHSAKPPTSSFGRVGYLVNWILSISLVISSIRWTIVPIHAPTLQHPFETSEEFNARKDAYKEEVHAAIYIINLHLPKKLAIHDDDGVTIKNSYDRMTARYKRSRAKEINKVTQQFLDIRLINEDTGKYCMDFQTAYQVLEDVTRMFCDVKNASFEEFMLPEGTAKLLFVQKTMHVDWLKFWRDSIKIGEEKLWELVKGLQMAHYLPACSEQKCTRCKRHDHKIKDCLKFHPKSEGWS
jgi:hypothetical protein